MIVNSLKDDFNEIENEGKTGLGKMKHWHIYNVMAKKK